MNDDWSGVLFGNDGYPLKDWRGNWFIAGGFDNYFKAVAIEFYGVKTKLYNLNE